MPQPKRKTTKATTPADPVAEPTDDAPATAPVIALDSFRPTFFSDSDVREIDVGNDTTLTVTLAHLTTRQAKQIPWSTRVNLEKVYRAAWRYVLDWDIRAHNAETGETIAIPAPGHPDAPAFATQYIGEDAEPWELLEYVLDNDTGSMVMSWLVNPGGMKLVAEQGKKSSTPSKDGDTPAGDGATGTK